MLPKGLNSIKYGISGRRSIVWTPEWFRNGTIKTLEELQVNDVVVTSDGVSPISSIIKFKLNEPIPLYGTYSDLLFTDSQQVKYCYNAVEANYYFGFSEDQYKSIFSDIAWVRPKDRKSRWLRPIDWENLDSDECLYIIELEDGDDMYIDNFMIKCQNVNYGNE